MHVPPLCTCSPEPPPRTAALVKRIATIRQEPAGPLSQQTTDARLGGNGGLCPSRLSMVSDTDSQCQNGGMRSHRFVQSLRGYVGRTSTESLEMTSRCRTRTAKRRLAPGTQEMDGLCFFISVLVATRLSGHVPCLAANHRPGGATHARQAFVDHVHPKTQGVAMVPMPHKSKRPWDPGNSHGGT